MTDTNNFEFRTIHDKDQYWCSRGFLGAIDDRVKFFLCTTLLSNLIDVLYAKLNRMRASFSNQQTKTSSVHDLIY